MLHLSPDLCYPPCNPVTKTMRSFVTRKPTVLGPLSADLIRVRKPDRPPCREVVNRDHGGGHVDRSVCFVCRPHGRRRSFFLGGRQVYHHPKSNTIPSHRVILGLWPPSGLGRRRCRSKNMVKPVVRGMTWVLRELKKIKMAWPDLNYTTAPGALILHPSKPSIAPLNQGQLTS